MRLGDCLGVLAVTFLTLRPVIGLLSWEKFWKLPWCMWLRELSGPLGQRGPPGTKPCFLDCRVHLGTLQVSVCGRVTVGTLGPGCERDNSLTEGGRRGRYCPGQPLKEQRPSSWPQGQHGANDSAPSLTPILHVFGLLLTFILLPKLR